LLSSLSTAGTGAFAGALSVVGGAEANLFGSLNAFDEAVLKDVLLSPLLPLQAVLRISVQIAVLMVLIALFS
jgi:hypothetical protein